MVVLYVSYTGSSALYGKANTEQRCKNKQTLSNATFKRLPLNSAALVQYCKA